MARCSNVADLKSLRDVFEMLVITAYNFAFGGIVLYCTRLCCYFELLLPYSARNTTRQFRNPLLIAQVKERVYSIFQDCTINWHIRPLCLFQSFLFL